MDLLQHPDVQMLCGILLRATPKATNPVCELSLGSRSPTLFVIFHAAQGLTMVAAVMSAHGRLDRLRHPQTLVGPKISTYTKPTSKHADRITTKSRPSHATT